MSTLLGKHSIVLISGILLDDENKLVSGFEKNGFVKKQFAQREGWIALLFQKQ